MLSKIGPKSDIYQATFQAEVTLRYLSLQAAFALAPVLLAPTPDRASRPAMCSVHQRLTAFGRRSELLR